MANLTPQLKAGQKLRELIARDFESQEDFAFAYGCDVRTVSRYVNQGIEKGINQGIEKRNIEIVRNMIQMNMDIKDISKITGLNIEEIKKIKERNDK